MITRINTCKLLFSNYDLSLRIFSSHRTYALVSATDFEVLQLRRGVPRPHSADQTSSIWRWPMPASGKSFFTFSSLNINSSYLHMYVSESYEYTMATRNHLFIRRLKISVDLNIRKEGFVNFNVRESSASWCKLNSVVSKVSISFILSFRRYTKGLPVHREEGTDAEVLF